MLAEQHAVADVDEQAEQPARPEAHEPGLPHAPEDEHQRDEIGHQRHVLPGQEIRDQRERQRAEDGARAHRQQDALRRGANQLQLLASPSFRRGLRILPGRLSAGAPVSSGGCAWRSSFSITST